MSYRLVEEVLAGAPADLTPGECLVLLVLAHHADEQTRECWPGMDVLAARTRMHPVAIRRVFGRLAKRGLDPRVTTARRGHRTVYRIPAMPDSRNPALPQSGQEGVTEGCANPEVSRNPRFSLPQPSVTDSRNPGLRPLDQEPSEPSSRSDDPMRDDKLDDAAALFSDTHPGREREALAAALALAARRGVEVRNPAAYFGAWSRDQRASRVQLPPSTEPLHAAPWCGDCDDPHTRWRMDDAGRIVRRCDCWSPRQ